MANSFTSGNHLAGSTSALSKSTEVGSQPQVHQMLDSGNFAIDSLEQTVSALIQRLADVSREFGPDDDGPATAQAVLVPVASRIAYITSRIRSLDSRLMATLNALEV